MKCSVSSQFASTSYIFCALFHTSGNGRSRESRPRVGHLLRARLDVPERTGICGRWRRRAALRQITAAGRLSNGFVGIVPGRALPFLFRAATQVSFVISARWLVAERRGCQRAQPNVKPRRSSSPRARDRTPTPRGTPSTRTYRKMDTSSQRRLPCSGVQESARRHL